ncbi:MAG: rhomboid family intramembrane serine protease [Candidatus Krumholzibacteriota bacterium]
MSFGGRIMTPAVKALIIANAAVFVLQTLFGGGLTGQAGPLTRWLAFIPHEAIFGLQVWRFFTYMFLHGGFWHIGFNMFALWMFGAQIEARWGQRNFLIYYFVCGLGGAVVYGIFKLFGMETFVPMIGASGAVMGILLAYGMTFPNSIILFMFVIPMKAKYFVILLALIDLMSIPGGGSVANLAHLGGMLAGFIFLKATIPALGSPLGGGGPGGLGGAWKRYQTKRKMRVVRPDEKNHGGNGRTGGGDEKSPDQKRIDLILDKISREGLQSLTDEEQEILRRAGRK